MNKRDFEGIMAGLADVAAIVSGDADPTTYIVHIPAHMDTKTIRAKLGGLTQEQFAKRFGFSVGAIRDWEQGRRMPDPALRAYLKAISYLPTEISRVLELA